MTRKRSHTMPPITRPRETELNLAIAELEGRGYELVKRGFNINDPSKFNYDQSTRYKSDGHGVMGKYWAVMKRVGVNV